MHDCSLASSDGDATLKPKPAKTQATHCLKYLHNRQAYGKVVKCHYTLKLFQENSSQFSHIVPNV